MGRATALGFLPRLLELSSCSPSGALLLGVARPGCEVVHCTAHAVNGLPPAQDVELCSGDASPELRSPAAVTGKLRQPAHHSGLRRKRMISLGDGNRELAGPPW